VTGGQPGHSGTENPAPLSLDWYFCSKRVHGKSWSSRDSKPAPAFHVISRLRRMARIRLIQTSRVK
jgi:hypothetical protein